MNGQPMPDVVALVEDARRRAVAEVVEAVRGVKGLTFRGSGSERLAHLWGPDEYANFILREFGGTDASSTKQVSDGA